MTGALILIARGITEAQALELERLSAFAVGAPFRVVPVLDPAKAFEAFPLSQAETVEIAGQILAAALRRAGS